MEIVFECLMLVLFMATVCIMISRFATGQSDNLLIDRIFAITECAAFVAGALNKMFVSHMEWNFALYVIGAYLSYTAALFLFSQTGAGAVKECDK